MAARLLATIAVLLIVPFVPLAAAEPDDDAATLVVGFRDALPDEARAGSVHGARVLASDEALRFVVVRAESARGFEERAARDDRIRYVQPEALAQADWTPNDPSFASQWAWTQVGASAAWDVSRGGAITVAVIDTGVDAAHADLAPNLLPGWDYLNNDAIPNDDCGHGTGVTGVVAAQPDNAVGIAGAADVSVMPLKALGVNSAGSCVGPFWAVAQSIRHAADNGARVISMSLGCVGCYDQATNDAIEYAWGKGVLLVASAGNNGPCTACVSWPAAHPRVIAVGATDSGNAQAYFSSSGPEVEVAAPGKTILTTYRGSAYGYMSGTSLAAPHVSGAAALALAANPSLTNSQLRSLLQSTSRDLGAAGRDAAYGYGLLDMAKLLASTGAAPPPAPNQPPTASFTATTSGLAVSVDAAASSDPDGAIATYRWSWGDGISFESATCVQYGHTYAAAGTYTITLTVTDTAGATASATRTVTVSAPANQPPVARFSWSASGLTLSVDGRASTDAEGAIAKYRWTWGDGSAYEAADASQATHAYAAGGSYAVTLTVWDAQGASSSTTSTVSVAAPAPAPAPAPGMHVGDIGAVAKKSGRNEQLSWSVPILDANGAPVADALVRVTINGAAYEGLTTTAGIATFKLSVPRLPGESWTLCVSSVALAGWTYDAAANVEACQSVRSV